MPSTRKEMLTLGGRGIKFVPRAWAAFSALGLLASILSVLVLVHHAFDVGLADPFKLLLEQYRFWVNAFFAWWADPLLDLIIRSLNTWFPLQLHLSPEWKHVFIVMWLYFVSGVRVDRYRGRLAAASFTMIWGLFVALIASVAFAALPTASPSTVVSSASIPILGIIVYELGRRLWAATFIRPDDQTWWKYFSLGVTAFVLPPTILGAIILLVFFALSEWSFLGDEMAPGLSAFFTFVFCMTMVLLGRGLLRVYGDRSPEQSWYERFNRSGSGRMSYYVLVVFVGVCLFLAANAGTILLGNL